VQGHTVVLTFTLAAKRSSKKLDIVGVQLEWAARPDFSSYYNNYIKKYYQQPLYCRCRNIKRNNTTQFFQAIIYNCLKAPHQNHLAVGVK